MRKNTLDVGPRRKAAIMLTLLGDEPAASVISQLSDEEIEFLALEVARLDTVPADLRQQVIKEFHGMASAQEYIAEGGMDQARRMLEVALGSDRAEQMVKKISSAMQVVPFDFLKHADPTQVLSFIQDEHPQTIALILSYMPMNQAASILTKLTPDLRADVAERIAMMEQTPPEVVRRVEQTLEKKVSSLINTDMTKAGGPKMLVDLLNRVDRSTERIIIENLTETNPELADQIKNMMFVFEDIVTLDDRAIQAILKEVDVRELATALKGTPEEVQQKIFGNMSERAVNMLKEDMEFMGPVKVRVVEEAQQKFVAVIRRLEEAGELQIGRGEEDVLV